MSKLLEIFGRAITVNTTDLIWHWLHAVKARDDQDSCMMDSDFEEILSSLGNMEFDQAQEKLQFYLFENPDCVRGRLAAVAIHLHRNQVPQAIEQAQSVYLRQPSNTMALYVLGYCHERLDNHAEAMEFYQDCIKFKGYLQLPRQRMAAMHLMNGRIDLSIREYELLTTEHPEDISSMVLLGYQYISDRLYEKAIDTFNMAILAHPDNFSEDGTDEELQELTDSEDYQAALERVDWLIDQIGEMPDLLVRKADVLSRASNPSEAIAYYERALRAQPNYLEATIKLGTHYLRFNRKALAAEQFNRAVEINDEIVDAYIGLALAQELCGETDEARQTLSLASAIQQNSTLLFSETATLNFKTAMTIDQDKDENSDTPEPQLVDVISAHQNQMLDTSKNADLHYKFGILMMAINKMDEAITSFENALVINPTHYRSRNKLAVCLYETDQQANAMAALTESDALDHNTLMLHYRTAILYCDSRKFANALNNLNKTMKQNFAHTEAIVNVEVVLENLGLVDRAITTWDRLTETAKYSIGSRYQ